MVLGISVVNKCGQLFGNQESLEHHILLKGKERNYSLFGHFECMHCVRVFSAQDAHDIHFYWRHTVTEKDLVQ